MTTNIKMPNYWILALKQFNHGKNTWCVAKKGTPENAQVREIMEKLKISSEDEKPHTMYKSAKSVKPNRDSLGEYGKWLMITDKVDGFKINTQSDELFQLGYYGFTKKTHKNRLPLQSHNYYVFEVTKITPKMIEYELIELEYQLYKKNENKHKLFTRRTSKHKRLFDNGIEIINHVWSDNGEHIHLTFKVNELNNLNDNYHLIGKFEERK